MTICEMCGEEIDTLTCPFCKTVQEGLSLSPRNSKKKKLKVVNIKDDMPLVETAIERLTEALDSAQKQGYKALKVIHGYGASGRGGVIKEEVQRVLHRMYANDEIYYWFSGEEFMAEHSGTLDVLKNHSYLENDEDFRKSNRGISIAIF